MKTAVNINESNFDTEVLKSSQPVLVDFWAEWCGPCKALGPVLEEVAQEQESRLKVVKVDVDSNQSLAVRYGIQSIPTLIFVANGEVKHQIVGAVSKKTILAALEKVAPAA